MTRLESLVKRPHFTKPILRPHIPMDNSVISEDIITRNPGIQGFCPSIGLPVIAVTKCYIFVHICANSIYIPTFKLTFKYVFYKNRSFITTTLLWVSGRVLAGF